MEVYIWLGDSHITIATTVYIIDAGCFEVDVLP